LQTVDFKPVVKLYAPWSLAVWLLTEIKPDDYIMAYGPRDPGDGSLELAYVSLTEPANFIGSDGLCIECDPHFAGDGNALELCPRASPP
jgi:hypothetical protein